MKKRLFLTIFFYIKTSGLIRENIDNRDGKPPYTNKTLWPSIFILFIYKGPL